MEEDLRPQALLSRLGSGASLMMEAQKVGMKIFPEFLLNAYLMNEFGPEAAPKTMYGGYQLTSQNMSVVEVGILTSAIMTCLKMGDATVKKSAVRFLMRGGPMSLKELGIKPMIKAFQKEVLGSVNPIFAPFVAHFLTKWGKTSVFRPAKGIIRGEIESVIDKTAVAMEKISRRAVEIKEQEKKVQPHPPLSVQNKTLGGGRIGRRGKK